jgi:hypothetical protein
MTVMRPPCSSMDASASSSCFSSRCARRRTPPGPGSGYAARTAPRRRAASVAPAPTGAPAATIFPATLAIPYTCPHPEKAAEQRSAPTRTCLSSALFSALAKGGRKDLPIPSSSLRSPARNRPRARRQRLWTQREQFKQQAHRHLPAARLDRRPSALPRRLTRSLCGQTVRQGGCGLPKALVFNVVRWAGQGAPHASNGAAPAHAVLAATHDGTHPAPSQVPTCAPHVAEPLRPWDVLFLCVLHRSCGLRRSRGPRGATRPLGRAAKARVVGKRGHENEIEKASKAANHQAPGYKRS